MTPPPDPPDADSSPTGDRPGGLSELPTELTPSDAPPPPLLYLKPGTMLAHFEIVERLGAGGFGVVYRARDTRLGRIVAVKLLPEEIGRASCRERVYACV